MSAAGYEGRTIREKVGEPSTVVVLDQRLLPHREVELELRGLCDYIEAIRDMSVRGAGLIGAVAGYGMLAAAVESPDRGLHEAIEAAGRALVATRPTAKDLAWAVERQLAAIRAETSPGGKRRAALETARAIADFNADCGRRIGLHGLPLIEAIAAGKAAGGGLRGRPRAVEILTHCNAGALAFVDRGSATAPIYEAFERGIPVHVWVDETRPRNQGAALTAWELGRRGIPHHLIADNAGGLLMQRGMVDLVIVGADRVSRRGDVANKIGTYLKALAAQDNGIPFYVALPSSTIDWDIEDGVRDIPVEERDEAEVTHVRGLLEDDGAGGTAVSRIARVESRNARVESRIASVRICPEGTRAGNFAFDITPALLVSGFITERGTCAASEEGLLGLFPEGRESTKEGVR
jgi:methylthioribose-1-phosphate isomerase